MQRLLSLGRGAFLDCLWSLGLLALGLPALPSRAEELTRPFELAHLAALPLLKVRPGPAKRISDTLAALDATAFAEARSCVLAPQDEASPFDLIDTGFYDRSIAVTMAGPDLLSLRVTDEAYCPGAGHGFTEITILPSICKAAPGCRNRI